LHRKATAARQCPAIDDLAQLMRLLQFTDTHLYAAPGGQLRGITTLRSLEACLAHARRRHLPADAVLVTGDLVQDEPAAYDTLELLLDDLGTPVLLVSGNHDRPDELRRRFGRRPFQVGGSRALARWTVVMLDTWSADSARGEGRLGAPALGSLEAMLEAATGRHVLVCLHHPPLPMDTAGLDSLGLVDGGEFLAVLGRHGNVRGVAWGHAHQALDLYRGQTRFMCTPSTCFQFKPRVDGFVTDDRPPGYRVIDLQDDGGIASEVVWLEGYRA
jgi:Icc protein